MNYKNKGDGGKELPPMDNLYSGYLKLLHSGNMPPPGEIVEKIKSLKKRRSTAAEEKAKAEARLALLDK